MASKKKFEKCRVKGCQVFLPCYDHCQGTSDGSHEADPLSAQQADSPEFIVDYNCKHCWQSGGVIVNPKDIAWA